MSNHKQTQLVEGALSVGDVLRNVDEAKGYQAEITAARRGNGLPPKSSNWYAWAKKNKLGVMDLDDLATDAGHKDFTHMDSAISPKDAMLKPRFAKAYANLKESSPVTGLVLDESDLSVADVMCNVDEAAVVVDTSEFRSSHGKEPSGMGHWAFAYTRGGTPFFIPGQMKYAAAKKAAKAKATAAKKAVLYTQP